MWNGSRPALNFMLTALLSRIRLPLPIPIQYRIEPDWRLLAYSAAVALGTCLAAGLMPALKATRAGLNDALKQDARQVGGRWTLRNALVIGQVAVSVVLLSAGLLFLRNLVRASTTSPGFDIEHTVWGYMRLVPESYTSPAKTRALVADRAGPLARVAGRGLGDHRARRPAQRQRDDGIGVAHRHRPGRPGSRPVSA